MSDYFVWDPEDIIITRKADAKKAEWNPDDHPRGEGGRFGGGGDSSVEETLSGWGDMALHEPDPVPERPAKYEPPDRPDAKGESRYKDDPAANSWSRVVQREPGTTAAMVEAQSTWADMSLCGKTQDAADDLMAGRSPSNPEAAFAARELLDSMSDPTHPGHYETDETLYRGMQDPLGEIAAKFSEGATVSFAVASFSKDAGVADYYASSNGVGFPEVVLQTDGKLIGSEAGAYEKYSNTGEIVSGGQFSVTSVKSISAEESPTGNPRTVVTIKQLDTP